MRTVSVHDLRAALDDGATVIDVREPDEYADNQDYQPDPTGDEGIEDAR